MISKYDLGPIEINGFHYAGYWDDKYNWQAEKTTGFALVQATEEDIANGNIIFMLKNELTNTKQNKEINAK